ncbi:MAG: DEAD/DEAH box helicase, partial [Bacillota bacterium]|nr:DEAD/DEAH box helicase [Bacillota bacterium]
MDLKELLLRWEKDPSWRQRIRLWHRQKPRAGTFLPWPDDIPVEIRRLFEREGLARLYGHQVQAWSLAREKTSFLLMTPTASGKSLAFHLPVLGLLQEDPRARALYIYPMKALAQDQLLRWQGWAARLFPGEGPSMAALYDGDTSPILRPHRRRGARVVLSNIPMLQRSLLGHPGRWEELLTHLKAVVVDEVHVYQGLAGGEAAWFFRRLWALLQEGQRPLPQVVAASATLGNPKAFARSLFGRPMEVIAQSGAPSPERHYLVAQESPHPQEEGRRWLAALFEAQVPAIAFCPSRHAAEELVFSLHRRFPQRKEAIVAYRAGYTPAERRSLEEKLRQGKASLVVATSALQLGIDIGALDAALVVGDPRSRAGLHQAWGRAGRRGHLSLAAWIPGPGEASRYPAFPWQAAPESIWLPATPPPLTPFKGPSPPLYRGKDLLGWDLEGRREKEPYLHQGQRYRITALSRAGADVAPDPGIPVQLMVRKGRTILGFSPWGERPLGGDGILRWGLALGKEKEGRAFLVA